MTNTVGTPTLLVMTRTPPQSALFPYTTLFRSKDGGGSTVTSYTGDKTLTFSGAASSTNPVTAPTVSSKTGVPKAIRPESTNTFTKDAATVSDANNGVMTLYKAESAVVAVTDGT